MSMVVNEVVGLFWRFSVSFCTLPLLYNCYFHGLPENKALSRQISALEIDFFPPLNAMKENCEFDI